MEHRNFTETCGSSKLARCLRHLTYSGHMNHHNAAVFPYIRDTQLIDICQAYSETHSCIRESLHECNLHQRHQLQAKDEALRFLCNEGLQGYRENRECFVREEVIYEARQCNTTFSAAIHSLKNSQQDISFQRDQMCRYLSDYKSCLRTTVSEKCGEDAGDWTYTMKTKLLQPTMVEMGCSDMDNNIAAVVAVIFAIVIGIAFLLLAVYIFIRCVKDGALFTGVPAEHTGSMVTNVRLKKLMTQPNDEGIRPLLDTSNISSPAKNVNKREKTVTFSDDEAGGLCGENVEEFSDKYMIRCAQFDKKCPTHL